jgi:hypothetical protein
MLGLPKKINLMDFEGTVHYDIDMWRFWQLEEGVLGVDPKLLQTNDGDIPPVIHVDTDAPLISDVDGSVITDDMWGIYYKPDWHFGGIRGGAAPYVVETPVDDVPIDPYGLVKKFNGKTQPHEAKGRLITSLDLLSKYWKFCNI